MEGTDKPFLPWDIIHMILSRAHVAHVAHYKKSRLWRTKYEPWKSPCRCWTEVRAKNYIINVNSNDRLYIKSKEYPCYWCREMNKMAKSVDSLLQRGKIK